MFVNESEGLRSNKFWIVLVMSASIIAVLTGVSRYSVSINPNETFDMNSGDTAWMLFATVLVMGMSIPGLSLYYGGFANKTSEINTFSMVFMGYCLVSAIWIIYGYGLAFGETCSGIIGDGQKTFLKGLNPNSFSKYAPTIPEYLFISFECTFASITAALVCGGFIERMKFRSWIYFVILWTTLVYLPIAHWVWGDGFLKEWGVIDFAGGTVVHINSGVAALVGTIALGMRTNPHENPKNNSYMTTGTGFLWVGWFGFNAGSALVSNGSAATAFINCNASAAVSSIIWVTIQRFHTGHPTLAGMCDGAISGLVGITPAVGYVNIIAAVIIGIASGIIPYWVIILKSKINLYDDTLNTFGIHFTSGLIGSILLGIYADPEIGGKSGLLFGNGKQLGLQIAGVLIATVYSAIGTAIVIYFLKYTVGIRVSNDNEIKGLDTAEHGEIAYFEYLRPEEKIMPNNLDKNTPGVIQINTKKISNTDMADIQEAKIYIFGSNQAGIGTSYGFPEAEEQEKEEIVS